METSAVNTPKVHSFYSDFLEITKARLAVSVVFSTLVGYVLGVQEWNWKTVITLFFLAIGGYCMVGASNVFNQMVETDLDKLMDRTKSRPLPSGRMRKQTAFSIGALLTSIGLTILFFINPKTALFAAVSIFMYVSLYTPLKTETPLSVFVGAFPGAIPFMLGWVAATGHFGIEAGTLFIVQFFWQFPHFWAIAWFLHNDYQKAGFKMLPTGTRDAKTALQIILYTIWTIIASILPVFGFTGRLKITIVSAVIVFFIGIWMLLAAIKLYNKQDEKTARKLMLVSVLYITLIQIIYVLDSLLFS